MYSETDCGVCYRTYNAGRRCPRELHCKHTFCESCLQALSRPPRPEDGDPGADRLILCPLCRHTTAISGEGRLRAELRVDECALERLVAAGVLDQEEDDDLEEEEESGKTGEEEAALPGSSAQQRGSAAGSGRGRLRRSWTRLWRLIVGKDTGQETENGVGGEFLHHLHIIATSEDTTILASRKSGRVVVGDVSGPALRTDSRPTACTKSMINADFCTGSVLISFGAVLGKTSPVQLLIMAMFEVTLFAVNEFILLSVLGTKDAGGSMTIHTFGAYFGLMVTRVLYRPNLDKSKHRNSSVYHSDMFAMIGTIYLWMFWPSFNSAITAHGDDQHRTALNTYYSLAACTLSTYAMSSLTAHDGKLDMVHIQNAALAGGVAAGTAGEMMLTPFGSMIVGFLAGIISVLGFKYLSPILEEKLKIQDTCGVHNLHGMPGILGAIVGAVTAAVATKDVYGDGMADVFPMIADGKDASYQGGIQAISLAVTLGIALLGGAIVGFILKLPIFGQPPDTICFEDSIYWEVPGEEASHEDQMTAVRTEETEKLNS